MRNAHRTVTRGQVTRHVRNAAEAAATNTTAVHVKHLRARLGAEDERLTQTVRGVGHRGYRLSFGIS